MLCLTDKMGIFPAMNTINKQRNRNSPSSPRKYSSLLLPSSEARESARVGLALIADQTSDCRFAYTLSSCNPQCFKYS